jgi:outer membrane lipoprotein-sorting protein
MTAFRPLFVILCTLIAMAASPFGARAADTSLEVVFARIDKAAATFKGLTADMKRLHHVELVNANDLDEGTITVKKLKANDIRILIKFTKPEPKMVMIGGGKAQVYTPKANEVQEADIKKHKDLINEVLLLGFGSSSKDLKASYTIQLGGPEVINGTPTVRIELAPKSEETRHTIKKCELWVPENGVPVQQKFYEGGGDYQIATYSHIVLNPNIPDSAIKLDLPKGVKVTPIR